MSSVNVLPTAPTENGGHYTKLYPEIQEVVTQVERTMDALSPDSTNPNSFRLTKISEIEKQIAGEEEHYRTVFKKYKKARKVVR